MTKKEIRQQATKKQTKNYDKKNEQKRRKKWQNSSKKNQKTKVNQQAKKKVLKTCLQNKDATKKGDRKVTSGHKGSTINK